MRYIFALEGLQGPVVTSAEPTVARTFGCKLRTCLNIAYKFMFLHSCSPIFLSAACTEYIFAIVFTIIFLILLTFPIAADSADSRLIWIVDRMFQHFKLIVLLTLKDLYRS
jgi:hypothetical protein